MEYTVVADGGTFEYSSAGRAAHAVSRRWQRRSFCPLPEKDGYAAEIAYFADCCRTGNAPELCPPEESAAAVALTRLLLEAANRNGESIECNL